MIVTRSRLRSLLRYEPENGDFICLVRRGSNAEIGAVAGSLQANGYIHIKIDGHLHKAHRLAWLYVHGVWPTRDIDHVNGNRADNRFANLREAYRHENAQNVRKARSNNKSCGLLGATWHKHVKKWGAKIVTLGERVHLGYFDTAQDAHQAYLNAKRQRHLFFVEGGRV